MHTPFDAGRAADSKNRLEGRGYTGGQTPQQSESAIRQVPYKNWGISEKVRDSAVF